MAWRYINPGYVHLLDKDAQSTATQVTGYEYSKTGTAFYQTRDNRGITLPNFAEGDDFWAKFDFYVPDNVSGYYKRIYFYAPCLFRWGFVFLYYPSGNSYIDVIRDNSNTTIVSCKKSALEATMGIRVATVNTALFHIKYGNAETAYCELTINNKKFPRYEGTAANYSTSYPNTAILCSVSNELPQSNIIFSNEEINIKEQVIALPVSANETAMTLQSDTYIADGVGQTLLQSVNVSSLIDEYGSDSKVTGIAVVGNPAYCTGEQLSSLTAISKRGGVVTEHGTSNLSTASDTVICQGFSTASDTMIADLQNMQFGWKASE